MKARKEQLALAARTFGLATLVLASTLIAAWRAWSQTTPPALSIAVSGTNQVTLTVVNGSPTNIYEVWWTEFLTGDVSLTNGAWWPVYTGDLGQTNFVLDLGDTYTGFFRALNGNDFDLDGVPNNQDARPFDPSVGILRVTIETPANGAVVY